ncbi:hypothetical protein SuUB36_15990 [Streptococcus uberis]|nr:hypothetical protein [Streptococcus uberis]MCK1212749.1 hypothetical protein [Streptococcus uberis]
MIKKKYSTGGYLPSIADSYIDANKPIYSLSTNLEPQEKFVDKHPTGEIVSFKAWFSQTGLPPFAVKFNSKIKLPPHLSIVKFDNLEACEVGYNVYFRANNIIEVK